MRGFNVLLASLLVSLPAIGQKPVINAGGVVNAASYVPPPLDGHALAYGSLATIFGRNLAPNPESAGSFPLPTTLNLTTVTVNGVPAPLLYVSPQQINFQVPSSSGVNPPPGTGYGQNAVLVSTASGSSAPVMVDIWETGPGIFVHGGAACGQGAILNVKPDGSTSLNSPSNSASPGDYLEIFGTGFGPSEIPISDGTPAPATPLPYVPFAGGAIFDGLGVASSFAGKAPGLVGVDQVNVQVPSGVREGCAAPLRSSAQNFETQPVLVSIHTGGGQCVDPPLGSLGNISVSKTVVMNATPPSEADAFNAEFDSSPGKQPPPPPPLLITPGAYSEQPIYPATPPSCPIPGYTNLDAGTLTLSAAELPATQVMPSPSPSGITYSATLPVGSVKPGSLQIAASGGKEVSEFQTSLALGADIHVTSQFPAGANINVEQPLVVNWTGGDANSIVTVKLISHQFLSDDVLVAQSVALGGSVTMQPFQANPSGPPALPIAYSSNAEVLVEVGPNPTKPIPFTAPGLTLGGFLSWNYTYDFPGLMIQPSTGANDEKQSTASHIIATGGAGSSGLPALASGRRTSSTPSNTSTTNPPQ